MLCELCVHFSHVSVLPDIIPGAEKIHFPEDLLIRLLSHLERHLLALAAQVGEDLVGRGVGIDQMALASQFPGGALHVGEVILVTLTGTAPSTVIQHLIEGMRCVGLCAF